MRITVVDVNGIREDEGPFDVEVNDAERAAIEGIAGKSGSDVVDVLSDLDDDRPDSDLREVIDAFEGFGAVATIEVDARW